MQASPNPLHVSLFSLSGCGRQHRRALRSSHHVQSALLTVILSSSSHNQIVRLYLASLGRYPGERDRLIRQIMLPAMTRQTSHSSSSMAFTDDLSLLALPLIAFLALYSQEPVQRLVLSASAMEYVMGLAARKIELGERGYRDYMKSGESLSPQI